MAFTMTVAEVIAADTSGLLEKCGTWERVPLALVASIVNGAPFDSALFGKTDGLPLVRIRDVLSGETSTFYAGGYETEHLVHPGDLLIGMDGDFHCAFWGQQTALLNQRVCKLVPDEAVYEKRLLGYVLPGYLSAINANTSSVTVKHLSSKTIGEIDLPLPPRAEQTRIVEKLEELLSGLDAGVAELKAAQHKLARYRQSLLKAAVQGDLTAAWRARHPPQETGAQLLARILAERRTRWEARQLAKFAQQGKTPPKDWQKKYPEPARPDTADLPALPQGWAWVSLDQLVAESSYGTSVKCSYEADGVPVLRIPNVVSQSIDLSDLKQAGEDLKLDASDCLARGDVLVVRTNGSLGLVGRSAAIRTAPNRPLYFASYLLRLRCVDTSVAHEWIATFMASSMGRRWIEARAASSAGQHNISLSTLLTMPVPLPPQQEQAEALRCLDAAFEGVGEQEHALNTALRQSTAQRQNILRAAFSGQLLPQNPADEPASALLARIRAERAAQGTSRKPRGRKAKERA